MADETRSATPPIVLRIKVRHEDPDAFVERFAPYVGRAGLFLRSKAPKPVGTELRFELRLADDRPVLVGMGVVRWIREPDPARPHSPAGMAVEFTRVTKESRGVILRMLELRRKLGLQDGPRGLPSPPDDDHGANVRGSADAGASGPIAVAAVPAPVAAAPSRPIAALPPSAPRARRPTPAELVANLLGGSGMADAFGGGELEPADLPGALARARALAGRDADRELSGLLEQQAAPVEITIEEASARLASLLGTAPVARGRRRTAPSSDSVPIESKPVFAPPPKVALAITADLVAPQDPERTRVVALEGLAQLTATPPPGATRVVNLDGLAASTAVRDPDERTAVSPPPGPREVGDDERTKVAGAPSPRRGREEDADDTLGFDRPRPSDTHRDPSPDAAAAAPPQADAESALHPRERISVIASSPPPPRAARRTQPPPPPPPRPRSPSPPPEPAAEAPTLDPGRARHVTSSGAIDLTDLVAELEAERAPPVRSDAGELGRQLAGEALDVDGLIADLDTLGRPRTPRGPYPDLASFADPPTSSPRPSGRIETLDAALAALEFGDPTSNDRPASQVVVTATRSRTRTDESIEIDLDDVDGDGNP